MAQGEAVTAYLDSLTPTARERVELLRARVHDAAPGLGETISYGILAFTLDGRTVCYTAGYARHASIYPLPDASEDPELAARMAPYVSGRGTLKFPHAAELPLDLVDEVVAAHLTRLRDG